MSGYGGFGKRHTPPILRSSSSADRSRSSGARNLFSSMSPPTASTSRNLFTSISSQPKKCASGDIEDSLGDFVSFFGGTKQWCIRDNPRSARPSQEHQMVRWNPSMMTTMRGTVHVKGEVVEVKRRKISSTAASRPSHTMTEVDVQDKVEVRKSSTEVPSNFPSATNELQMKTDELQINTDELQINTDELQINNDKLQINNDDLAMNADNGDKSDLPSEEENQLLDGDSHDNDNFFTEGYDEEDDHENFSINVDTSRDKRVISRKDNDTTIPYSDQVPSGEQIDSATAINIAVLDNGEPQENEEEDNPTKDPTAGEQENELKMNTSSSCNTDCSTCPSTTSSSSGGPNPDVIVGGKSKDDNANIHQSLGKRRPQTPVSENKKPKKQIGSPISKEDRIKNYMQKIGTAGVKVSINSPAAKAKEAEYSQRKDDKQSKKDNKTEPPKKPDKKSHKPAAKPDKKSHEPAAKPDKKSHEPDERTTHSVELPSEENLDETNNLPAGRKKIDDKMFEEIFKGTL